VRIEVFLDVNAPRAAEIRPQLDAELHALHQEGIDISSRRLAVQPGALSMTEAFAFVIEHGKELASAMTLITAVVQLANSVVGRFGKSKKEEKGSQKNPSSSQLPVVISIEGHEIPLPATDDQVRRYLKKVQSGPKKLRPQKAKAKRSTVPAKKESKSKRK
jgi:hypothetical protein